MTKKKKHKSKTKITINEFQTWLEGIMEFQDDDWSPNNEQWNAIYERIMNLKDATNNSVNISKQSINEIVNETRSEIYNNIIAENNKQTRPPSANTPHQATPKKPNGELFNSTTASDNELNDEEMEIISADEFPQLTQEEIDRRIADYKKGVNESTPPKSKTIKTPDILEEGPYKSNFGA